ncbi:hypothetical protein S245_048234, partial [Arachis hypogaea]
TVTPSAPSRRQLRGAVGSVAPSDTSRSQHRRALSSIAHSAPSRPQPLRPVTSVLLRALRESNRFPHFQGDVSGSLVEFDRAIELDPRQKAYLWQRGLSLYYLD